VQPATFAAVRVDAYEVLSVSRFDEVPGLRGLDVDSPQADSGGGVYVLPVSGRVDAADSPAVAIEVIYHERVLRTAPVNGSSFEVLVGLVGLKLESELELRAVLENGDRIAFASITVRRRPLESGFEPTINPLILTSLGRSGTTWLMKMFASHPAIVVFRRFPYEYSVARYWMHVLRVLSEPSNQSESADADTFQADLHWVGNNPFHDQVVFERPELEGWMGREYPEQLAAFCQSAIEEWYSRVARVQQQDGPTYFAEKMGPSYIPLLTQELYPHGREVVLVRDFRDVACSTRQFDSGRPGSHEPMYGSGNEIVPPQLQAEAFAMQNVWKSRGGKAHLVRYEDMITRPHETLAALLDYVGVDASQPVVEELLRQGAEDSPELPGATADEQMVESHRTIADPADTIGRWRQNGGESNEDLYWDAFGEPLEEFGYTKSGKET
jgi:hypothetical protein